MELMQSTSRVKRTHLRRQQLALSRHFLTALNWCRNARSRGRNAWRGSVTVDCTLCFLLWIMLFSGSALVGTNEWWNALLSDNYSIFTMFASSSIDNCLQNDILCLESGIKPYTPTHSHHLSIMLAYIFIPLYTHLGVECMLSIRV